MFDIDIFESISRLTVYLLPMMLGIILHELAHGWVALLQGDPTAKLAGRLTLNPIKHLDPAGTMVFVLTSMLSPVAFGWAKPVPINPIRFRNLNLGLILVSAAGPATNLVLAIGFAGAFRVLLDMAPASAADASTSFIWLLKMCQAGVLVNLVLMVINLIPLPPLDGSKILTGLLPPNLAQYIWRMERWGIFLVMLLFVTGMVGKVIWPIVSALASLLLPY